MHEFYSNVNKVNKAVAKVRTIGDRLPLKKGNKVRLMPGSMISELLSSTIFPERFQSNRTDFNRRKAQAQMMPLSGIIENCFRFRDTMEVNEFGLLLMSVCIIAAILISVSHL